MSLVCGSRSRTCAWACLWGIIQRRLRHGAGQHDGIGVYDRITWNFIRYVAPPGAFYAFVGVEGLTDSMDLALKLVANHRVAVAPGVAFGEPGEGFLRVCFAQSAERMERAM